MFYMNFHNFSLKQHENKISLYSTVLNCTGKGSFFNFCHICALLSLNYDPPPTENIFRRIQTPLFTFTKYTFQKGRLLTHFMPLISFDTPENIRKLEVFWCFKGVSKEISGMKWVKMKLLAQKQKQSKKLSSAMVRTKKLKEHKINTQKNKTLWTLC